MKTVVELRVTLELMYQTCQFTYLFHPEDVENELLESVVFRHSGTQPWGAILSPQLNNIQNLANEWRPNPGEPKSFTSALQQICKSGLVFCPITMRLSPEAQEQVAAFYEEEKHVVNVCR